MENMFLQALSVDERLEIDNIKRNKFFALNLLKDLQEAYHAFVKVEDNQKSVVIHVDPTLNRRTAAFRFIADKDGVRMCSKNLGYRTLKEGSKIPTLGKLYDKYKDFGTTAESGFLSETHGHGFVNFIIPIVSGNLNDTMRDIIYLLNFERFNRKF